VETMFSYEVLFSVFGDVTFADRIEMLAFNALPAAITPVMWAHVYLQQGNQINAKSVNPYIYVSDGPDSNIYGLEPNFGCCTANFVQGWPKYVTHMFMRTGGGNLADDGLIAVLYGPCSVQTQLRSGANTKISVVTDYPFDDQISITVTAEKPYPLYLRIPEWCKSASVTVGSMVFSPKAGTTFRVNITAPAPTNIAMKLPMRFKVEKRYNDAVAISRGPLLYALKVGEKWTELDHHAYNSSDWQIDNTTQWAYALQVNFQDPEQSFQYVQGKINGIPFSPDGTPVVVYASGKTLPQWQLASNNAADAPPPSPVTSNSPIQIIQLIPYGASGIRIVEFPYLST